jgi:hypothetical protein
MGSTEHLPQSLLPGRLLRRAGPPELVERFQGVQIDDACLAVVLAPEAPLLRLYEGTLHGEGTGLASDAPSPRVVRRAEPAGARVVSRRSR